MTKTTTNSKPYVVDADDKSDARVNSGLDEKDLAVDIDDKGTTKKDLLAVVVKGQVEHELTHFERRAALINVYVCVCVSE